MQFLRKNQAKLNQLPTAIFSVHLLNTGDDEGSRAKREAYTAPARPIVTPRAETFFAGRLDFSKLTLFESLMSKAMKAQEQDFDWTQIRSWAEGLYPSLIPA